MNKLLLPVFGALLVVHLLGAQNTSDIVVPVTVTTSSNPPVINLSFPATANAVSTLIGRKFINQVSWNFIVLPANSTGFADSSVLSGIGYEYIVIKQTSVAPTTRVGLVYAGIEVPAPTYRGKMILLVDDQLSTPLAMELNRLVDDLRGDGWQVIRRDVNVATSSVKSIKAVLADIYNQDPDNTVTALLFGDMPVPYSGDINPEGVPGYQGARPTDYYYSDLGEQFWTDTSVNNTTALRMAYHNVPGDGKFDRSQIPTVPPTLPEMVVSRVDFSNLTDWDVSQTELYRRYLDKNHKFRSGAYKPEMQTLVDDNLGFAGGGAFAQNGWRNGYALTGASSIVQGDFLADTKNQSFLLGYGCGNGNFTNIVGVANSDNFKTDSVNIVFPMLFGPLCGDWDFDTNPLLPSVLASKGGALATVWAGLPNWHFHHMGLGEPILTSTLWVWINSFLANPVYPPNGADDLVHVGLLGDPSLRAHYVLPPKNLTAMASCNDVTLSWDASPDADEGYLVYRASSVDSIFELIVNAPINATTFIDTMPLPGTNHYQVRAFHLEIVPTGSYYNQSTGVPVSIDFSPSALTATATATNVSCNGSANGAIELDVTGGANYSFEWSNGETTQNIADLESGTYTVTVTDAQGCSTTTSASITEPAAIAITPAVSDALCFGDATGDIQISISGGTPDFAFEWSDGSTGQNLPNVAAGVYTVTVIDMNGCVETATVQVNEPTAIVSELLAENASCNGSADGSLELTVDGGAPGYAYEWSDGSTNQNLANVAAGTYTVTITDANGCTQTASETITEPDAISTSTAVANAGCAGATNGAIDLSVDGGTPGYTFTWSTSSTTEDLTDVAAGTYTVTVTDAAGCTQTATATVGQVTTLVTESNQTNVSCFGQADGSAEVLASGGDPDYTYLWSNNETTPVISNLPAGTYTVTVTDNAGCSQTAQATVAEPPLLTAGSVWNAQPCMQDVGTVTLTVDGGTPDYTFDWSTGATTQNLEDVAPGLYTVTITDANGCTIENMNIVVQPPGGLMVQSGFAQTSCPGEEPVLGDIALVALGGTPGYTYLWSNGATTANLQGVPDGTYTVTITDAQGCTVVHTNTAVAYIAPWEITALVTNISCNGVSDGEILLAATGANGPPYSYNWSTDPMSGLPAGTYTVTVTDALGCTDVEMIVLLEPDAIDITNPVVVDADCSNGFMGSITVDAIVGGTIPYETLWTGPDGFMSDQLSLTGLSAGQYTLAITDANGCTSQFGATVSEGPTPPDVLLNGFDTVCMNVPETFVIFPDAGTNYQWNAGPNGTVVSGQGTSSASIQWSTTGAQTLEVTYNYDGDCVDSRSVSIFVDICVGTKEPKLAGVHIQPNPFGEFLQVLFDRPVDSSSRLRLLDMQGRLIYEQSALTETTRLETSSLPAGSYLLQVIENGQAGIWKVVRY
ncbi:MAG: T9SS type A sorting domain-containing protein [Lewinellaceae bacterium]|nr:T9SS type A sorting domain-containing protein [Saprospiraceae bacterium]MCB9331337.1 T9SS type A sorting domain-containing protein [Lewinellaceae bacterium]